MTLDKVVIDVHGGKGILFRLDIRCLFPGSTTHRHAVCATVSIPVSDQHEQEQPPEGEAARGC